MATKKQFVVSKKIQSTLEFNVKTYFLKVQWETETSNNFTTLH